jgi:tRNA pseudouridine13 synthase
VAANRFTVVVSRPEPDALSRARVIADRLRQTGVPNFYGPQRFGHGMRNIRKGFAHFSPGKKGRRDTFMVSVVQSALFNIWLKKRMETGDYRRLLAGDIVKKTDTGGMFIVDDPVIETSDSMPARLSTPAPFTGSK